MSTNRPRLALDLYVLAQGVRTGIYRVCDELFFRLAASDRFETKLLVRSGDEERASAYIASKGMLQPCISEQTDPGSCADILLSPFGVAPKAWRNDPAVMKAHIVYDLIAIYRPEYFGEAAVEEVRAIIESLDEQTVVFVISEFTKQELLEYRQDLSPAQVTVIPLAAREEFEPCNDLSRQEAVRVRYGIPAGIPYVLSLATLEIRKNLEQVVEATVRFFESSPDSSLHLVLAGMAGWKLEKLEQALSDAGPCRERIILTGFVADEDLSALYSGALCFLYLSRYEGFGLPPLEAMACGTPVICSDGTSLPEVVGEAAIMVDPDDTDGVAHALQQVVSSSSLRDLYRQRGLERAALFDWDRCAAIVSDALDSEWRRRVRKALPASASARAGQSDEQRSAELASVGPAGCLIYRNGSSGPEFSLSQTPARAFDWPVWTDRISTHSGAAEQLEGGLRLQGRFKSSEPGLPLVSYITVVRNNPQTLGRTIDSVQRQSYSNVEHVIVDGASTDAATLEVIRAQSDCLDYFVSEPDLGLYDAVNKAVQLARGQLICVLNSDDWLEPFAAEIAARRMRSHVDEAALLFTGALVDAGSETIEWTPELVHPGSYFTCANVCHNGIYATRAAYEFAGKYDTDYRIAADFKWIMRGLDAGLSLFYTREPTVNYALGGTSSDVRTHSVECMRVVRERFPFLSDAAVSGLYHCFFKLAGATIAMQGDRPASLTQFVSRLFASYGRESDFISALGWAMTTTFEHPADAPSAQATRSASTEAATSAAASPAAVAYWTKLAAKRLLHRHPALYDAAARGYKRLRG